MAWLLRHPCGETMLPYSFDADGGIGVSVKHEATDRAPMRSHRLGLLLDVATPATRLRGVGGIDRNHQATSIFSFRRQDGAKHGLGSLRD